MSRVALPNATRRLDHAQLCAIASRWLRVPHSRGGHGCQVAFTETRLGYLGGETPDAIGFRAKGYWDGSVLVECKISRADFLADAKKAHRRLATDDSIGLGRFRYYLCPEGLIQPDDLPLRWGLLYVNNRRQVKTIAGAACLLGSNARGSTEERMDSTPWTFHYDAEREVLLLTQLLHRIGDAEKLNLRLREAEGNAQRLAKRVNQLTQQVSDERLRWALERNERLERAASNSSSAGPELSEPCAQNPA